MPEKPTYKELEQRILELEERKYNNKSSTIAFPQFEKHHAVILIIDPDSGAIMNANIAAEKYYGYPVNTLKQMKIQDINMLPPDEIAKKRQQAADEKLNYFEFPHRLSNGVVRTVQVHSSPIIHNGKKLLLSIICDITDRKKTEKALRDSEKRFRSIIENTQAGYFFIDKNGIIQEVNQAWVELYRYKSAKEIVGHHFDEIQKIEDIQISQEFVENIMRGDSKYLSGEFSRKCKDGTIGYHTFSANPVIQNNKVIGIEGFIIDSTERKKAEEQRDKLIAELQKALSEVKILRGFLPICSHCKKIRDDKGYWNQIESYINQHSDVKFSHGICPDCAQKYYPDMDLYDGNDSKE